MKYKKLFSDYLTKEQALEKAREYAKEQSQIVRWGRTQSVEDIMKGLSYYIEKIYEDNDEYYNKLQYIREAIIHKSLGGQVEDLETNGRKFFYQAIYDQLPIIKDLEKTEEYFAASWGYDQTNIDIAFRLNKKVFGLDGFADLKQGRYWLKRVKNDSFNDGVRYFRKGRGKWQDDFAQDASQTGQYR